jgi:VIT1/CCC1 family predicted Fe2+/Mn2+ transporter
VAGAEGGGVGTVAVIILGFANLIADGFSMAVGNYHAASTRRAQLERARRIENEHIEAIPDGEREEIRQILEAKGLRGLGLQRAVTAITSNRRLWVDIMITEEWGLGVGAPAPGREGAATFAAFVGFGLLPLLPYLGGYGAQDRFVASAVLTGLAFLGVGALRGYVTESGPLRSALGTLAAGGMASALAYGIGSALRHYLTG